MSAYTMNQRKHDKLNSLGEKARRQLNEAESAQTSSVRNRLVTKQLWWECSPSLFAITSAVHDQLWMEHFNNGRS